MNKVIIKQGQCTSEWTIKDLSDYKQIFLIFKDQLNKNKL